MVAAVWWEKARVETERTGASGVTSWGGDRWAGQDGDTALATTKAFDAEVYVIYQVLCLCYLQEASLARLTSTTTEARTQGTGDWITSHVKSSRCYRPLKGGSTRPDLRKERKE